MTDTKTHVELLEQRLRTLEARVAKLEGHKVEGEAATLKQLLRSYPGGVQQIAADCDYHYESIYAFQSTNPHRRHEDFPFKMAMRIARAFGDMRVFGRRVTIERLRLLWEGMEA